MHPHASALFHAFTRQLAAGVALLTALVVTGCQSARTTRLQDYAELFQSLDPHAQTLIQNGLVDYGFTSELVYLALGKPNRVAAATTAGGYVEIWTYRNFLYAAPSAAKLGVNHLGTRPVGGAVITAGAPDGAGQAGTRAGPAQPTLGDTGDMPVGTLVLELLEGRIVTIRIDP